ncbi:MAG: hypothetical protein HZA93_27705 [Verrucomicrobia bacterium]|nr:hypothetical protein [Verrucomicrobiota bacterium]
MSVAEVKEQITRMSPVDREELWQFMRAQQLMVSPEYRARVEQAHREIDAGKYVTLEQLKELITKNQAARRAS